MRKSHFLAALFVVAGCLSLGACNGSSSTPSPTPPAPTNISGDYSGTMQDSSAGSGTASGTLAQHGSSAGGNVTLVGSSKTVTAQMSLAIDASNAISGTIVIDYPSPGPTCTFSTAGSYDTTTNVLSGTYTAVTNCSGGTGTFSLTQQCTDTVTSGRRRPMHTPVSC
jgi:hypothetical protein